MFRSAEGSRGVNHQVVTEQKSELSGEAAWLGSPSLRYSTPVAQITARDTTFSPLARRLRPEKSPKRTIRECTGSATASCIRFSSSMRIVPLCVVACWGESSRSTGKCVRSVVVDSVGEQDARTTRLRRCDGVPNHWDDQSGPIFVSRRVHRMNDGIRALGGCHDRIPSKASPFTRSQPRESPAFRPVLESARIFQPCRESARAVSPPIPPEATRTRAIRPDSILPP